MESLVQAVLNNCILYSDKKAIIFNDKYITYKDLGKKILAFSDYLKKKNIKKGSKIAIEADNPILFYSVFLAVQLNSCIVIPLEKGISLYHLQEIIKSQNPAMVFSGHTGELSDISFNTDTELFVPDIKLLSDTPAAIISTTGTTGNPVMIVHTNNSILSTTITYLDSIPMNQSHVLYTCVPFHLAGGFRRVLSALYVGATSVISHNTFSAENISSEIDKNNINFLCTVNSNISSLFNCDEKYINKIAGNIDIVETYAGKLTSKLILNFYQLFPDTTLYNVYGTTESGCLLINNTKENPSDACIGKPTKLAEIFILDENDNIITDPGKYGYFAVKGPVNMKEYYRKKALTRQVMNDGLLKINDIGYFDENGYFYYVSRVGDIMNVNGYTITPDDIENIAINYQNISDCACACTEVSGMGQLPILYVVPNDNYDKKDFLNFLLNNMEAYKIPAAIREVSNIPRTTTGKVIRNVLPMLTTI